MVFAAVAKGEISWTVRLASMLSHLNAATALSFFSIYIQRNTAVGKPCVIHCFFAIMVANNLSPFKNT